MLAAGALETLEFGDENNFEALKQYHITHKDWLIGYFTYDLKNEVEILSSENNDTQRFPLIAFYVPEHLIFFDGDVISIESTIAPQQVLAQIEGTSIPEKAVPSKCNLQPNTSRVEYTKTVDQLKDHILDGDIYEINYCIEFAGENVALEPVATYLDLMTLSPAPFSVFHKSDHHYLISASPERFLKKEGKKLISQPIKGTAKRGASAYEDELMRQKLRTDEKELAENMMIVDLVRNDLARSAKPGTVKVEEMFGIYTFRQLHQMISTVTAELKEEVHFIDAIKNAFPMGSMTGAPKIKVMQLIEQYETAKRGLYSGAMGYITPEGNFDFNVVIRSLLYNSNSQKISFGVGSAITSDAQAAQEYDECMLKAQALLQVLGGS